jgi:hypothetical protein
MDDIERVRAWSRVVRGEYLDSPGLQLTQRQAQRLWGLDERLCAGVLQKLVEERFLQQTVDGRYTRTDIGDF